MGFFDSVLPTGNSGASAQAVAAQPAPAATVAAPAAAAPSFANDADFLIIDSNVSVSNVPDTVLPTAPAPQEHASSDVITFDVQPAAEVPSEPAVAQVSEAPASSGLDFSALSGVSFAPVAPVESAATEAVVSFDVPAAESAPSSETPEVATAASHEEAASFGSWFFVLDEAAPASAETSATVEAHAESAFVAPSHAEPAVAHVEEEVLDPEAILAASIEKLESVVSAKESARDAETALVEQLNEKIAELKQQAKDAQERAREIDASADRARSLIANLKSQIQAA